MPPLKHANPEHVPTRALPPTKYGPAYNTSVQIMYVL